MEIRYTQKDKEKQLARLVAALSDLIVEVKKAGIFPEKLAAYDKALSFAKELASEGFEQSELNELQANIPDLFYRHKEWVPPLEDESDRSYPYHPAKWFLLIDKKLELVLEIASELRSIGYIKDA